MNKKILIGAGLALFVAILVVGGMFAVKKNKVTPPAVSVVTPVSTTTQIDMTPVVPQAKVSTEGWKVCRKPEAGFEFKYPPDWVPYSGIPSDESDPYSKYNIGCFGRLGVEIAPHIMDWSKEEDRTTTYHEMIRVGVEHINYPQEKRTIDEWFSWINKDRFPTQEYLLRKVYLIGGQRALFRRLVGQGEVFNPETDKVGDIQFVSPDKTLLITIDGQRVTNPTLDPLLETILSTFKFIEKTPAK